MRAASSTIKLGTFRHFQKQWCRPTQLSVATGVGTMKTNNVNFFLSRFNRGQSFVAFSSIRQYGGFHSIQQSRRRPNCYLLVHPRTTNPPHQQFRSSSTHPTAADEDTNKDSKSDVGFLSTTKMTTTTTDQRTCGDKDSNHLNENSVSDADHHKAGKKEQHARKKRINAYRKRRQHRQRQISLLKLQSTPTPKAILEDDFLQLSYQFEVPKFKWIEGLAKELEKYQQQQQQQKKAKSALNEDPQRRLWKVVLQYLDTRKVPKEIRQRFFLRMVDSREIDAGSIQTKNGDIQSKKSLTQQQIVSDVKLLQQARALAIHHPMSWSRESNRKIRRKLGKKKGISHHNTSRVDDDDVDIENTATTVYNTLPRLPVKEYMSRIRVPALAAMFETKSEEQQYNEAVEFQKKMQERLPLPQYLNAIKYVQDFADSCNVPNTDGNGSVPEIGNEQEAPDNDSQYTNSFPRHDLEDDAKRHRLNQHQQHVQQELRILKTNLQRFVPKTRLHMVAEDFAKFFHIMITDPVMNMEEQRYVNMIRDDAVVCQSQQKWEETQETYVKAFQNVQELLQKAANTLEENQHDELTGRTLQNDLLGVSQEESILETFDGVMVGVSSINPPQMTTTERVRPRRYTVFEAMEIGKQEKSGEGSLIPPQARFQNVLPQEGGSKVFRNDLFPAQAPTDRMVFIDNLPIDVEVDRLKDAFGRCGTIEALEIFHQRPELDPGRKAIDNRKKIRSPSSNFRRQRWQRPRTPLYGIILYKEATSAAKAVADPLRIFGMVLDHHLIRTQKAAAMTKLYLEDVASSHDTTAIEYDLSRILHPDLYVCLDVSGHRRGKRRRGIDGETSSCVIKFPTFESAYWAYQKLSLELEYLQEADGTCGLHWMQTPPDAMLYWTRQLNF
ncbi:hypothetical protein IV203_013441 [Nitzschia inconspicua]|uniref:RRM domain-containing protein n=1 Tax=Nitzschia inconspicua TaxID=303405 RepID=A0A9K3M702_9STRA|nr:hypothetical protein IV203_013441 [Nitzschia inconspicua]